MPKPGASPYLCRPLADLAGQLGLATPQRCHEYVRRAERLHDQIDPEAAYPIDFLAYRVTGQRHLVDSDEESPLLTGQAVLPDLRQLIADLSRRHPLPVGEGERIELIDDLASRLNVSVKTLDRWRKAGLRWRWTDAGSGRPQRGFTREAIDRFASAHEAKVRRASRFSQMSDEDRARLIERARRLTSARPELSLNRVALHLSRRSGRALETIRLLLEHHDRDHPDDRLFVDHRGPLRGDERRVIARAYRMGVPVSKIARYFRRSHSTIHRAIQDRRAAVLRRMNITFVMSRTFEREDAETVILRPQSPAPDLPTRTDVPLDDLPAELRPLFRQPGLDAATQQTLFVRYNYLKYRASGLRDALDRYEPRAGDLDRIEAWLKEAARLRDRLVAANLPVVLSVCRRHLLGRTDSGTSSLVDLLEVANDVLIEAIDAYDFARDRTFDSYLTFVLMRRLASHPAQARRAHRRLSGGEMLRRLRDKAGESGVMLAIRDDDPQADPDATTPPA